MEAITKNSGFQHVGEDIFKLLDKESALNCRMVNSSWKRFFDQPLFWLKKLDSEITSLKEHQVEKEIALDEEKFSPEKIHQCWKKLVKELEDANISTEFTLILIKIYKSEYLFQLRKTKTYSLENDAICVPPDFIKFVFDHSDDGYGTTEVYGTIMIFFKFGCINRD